MSIKDLSLAARQTIDGFMTGINKSRVKGPGLEFSQYRSYQPGDDLRWLDWKRYARSDRYYIRESEIETNITIRLLVDASASMAHRDDVFTKLDYARYLAASLGWLAHLQGDALGLYVFRSGGVSALPSRQDAQHLARFFHLLENIEAQGAVGDPAAYSGVLSRDHTRSLLVFITDCYEQDGEITRLLEMLVALGHEVIVFHVMGRNELEGYFPGYDRVEDLESGVQASLSNGRAHPLYQEQLQAWLAKVKMQILDRGVSYRLLSMETPLDEALRDFLRQRNR